MRQAAKDGTVEGALVLLTNFERFPERWQATGGWSGRSLHLRSAWEFLRYSRDADLVIVNCEVDLTMRLCLLYMLFPFLRRPLLGHDLILRRPSSLRSRLTAPIKKFLLSKVDHFTHHFHILDGYEKYYGIGPERSSYLPFKPNIRYRHSYKVDSDGEYILCFGRSERDYDTFFQAMERLAYPAVIPTPAFDKLREHASRFTRSLAELPANVKVVDDDGSAESLIRIIEGAKLVVLPIVSLTIAPSGIGTYLNAMLMGKCVITTGGPGTSDVLKEEALLVPPENPEALAQTIGRAWEDTALRQRTAEAGRRYSESCGGEPELQQRVLERALEKLIIPRRRPTF